MGKATFLLLVLIAIGTFVFREAASRGIDAWIEKYRRK
jgi:hypothetical protein